MIIFLGFIMTITNKIPEKAPRQFNSETDEEYLKCDHCSVLIEGYHPYHYTIGDNPHVHLCYACHIKHKEPKWLRYPENKPYHHGYYNVVFLMEYDFIPCVKSAIYDADEDEWEDVDHGVIYFMELPEPPKCAHWQYKHYKYPENKPEKSGYIWVCEHTEDTTRNDFVWYDKKSDKFLTDKLNVSHFLEEAKYEY